MTFPADILAPASPPAAAPAEVVHCAHCDQPVPAGLVEAGAAQQFCCAGCRAVFETLRACGLESYYRLRDAADASGKPVTPSAGNFEAFDAAAFYQLYVEQRSDGLATVDLILEGVTCAACVWLVERLPRVLDGVVDARLSLREATVRVTWDPARLPLSRIAQTLDRIGYTPHPARGMSGRELHRRDTRRRLVHIGIAGAIMGNTMILALALYAGNFGHMEPVYRNFFRWISALLGALSLAWPGAVFFRSAWSALRMRTTNLDVPIALALVVGGVAGLVNVVLGRGDIYFDSLTVLVFLLLVGRFVQYRQQRRADDAVGLLFSLTPSTCRVVREGDGGGVQQVVEVPIEGLRVGDLVEVRAGDLFPADGAIESGQTTVNQALLTGESMPVAAAAGHAVHAGSQNVASAVRVRVRKVGQDTRVGQLMRLIERGVQDKPPIVQLADRVGGWFVIVISLVAAGVFAYWSARQGMARAIDHTVALLIVTCPCVLGLATPLTIAIAIGRLARQDILVKSGAVLERLSRGGRLLLDKTGTLTEGRMQLLQWIGDESLQPLVAAMEQKSNHPVGRALHWALAESGSRGLGLQPMQVDPGERASSGAIPLWHGLKTHATMESLAVVEKGDGGLSVEVDGRRAHVGSPSFVRRNGVAMEDDLQAALSSLEADGTTAVVVAVDGVARAVAGLGDRVRDDSRASVAALRSLDWQPSILSGDAADVVRHVADHVGIEPARAAGQMTPEQKLQRVTQSESAHDVTVMVGDGVNDAAALAAADVGIAVHGGAEASLSAADVYVARPGLRPLVSLVRMSRRTMRTVRRNLCVSLAYNLLAGTLAAAGVMTPLIAAILMPISSGTVLSLAIASISRRDEDEDAAVPQLGRGS